MKIRGRKNGRRITEEKRTGENAGKSIGTGQDLMISKIF